MTKKKRNKCGNSKINNEANSCICVEIVTLIERLKSKFKSKEMRF